MQSILERAPAERKAAAQAFIAEHPANQVLSPYLAAVIVPFVRDASEDWQATLSYIDSLPPTVRQQPFVREQRALAESKNGDHHAAIAALKTLISLAGATPERHGLLGGRYKKLYRASKDKGEPWRAYLDAAIEHYETGMNLDLNEYYCSCNLPALYRERGEADAESRAVAVSAASRLACERAISRGSTDEWLPPTLLGLAFSEGNADAAEALSQKVARSAEVDWKLETTLSDLRAHVEHHAKRNAALGAALAKTLERLTATWNSLQASARTQP
jgi:hypothetical protein